MNTHGESPNSLGLKAILVHYNLRYTVSTVVATAVPIY